MTRRKQKPPTNTGKEEQSLTDRAMKRIKDNHFIAALIILGTIVIALIGFWQKIADFYEEQVEVPLSLAAFNLSRDSDSYFDDKPFTCRFDEMNVRTFSPATHSKTNRAVSLDFVFTNKSKRDALITGVDLDVSFVGEVAGGSPGIVVPNHEYVLDLKHQLGTQSFPLTPVYRVPGNDTGSFTITFSPASEGIGLCWILRAIFHSNVGNVESKEFSVIMSKFKLKSSP